MLRKIRDLGFEYAELSRGVSASLMPGIAHVERIWGTTRFAHTKTQRRKINYIGGFCVFA